MIKNLPTIVLIFFLVSCSSTDKERIKLEYAGSKQILSVNNKDKYGNDLDTGKLHLSGKDTVVVNTKALFKLIVTNPNLKIVRAYINCQTDSKTLVDTVNYKIDNCTKQLTVINDTIVIQLTPTIKGKKNFHPITAVTVNNDSVIRVVTGTFKYFVTE